MDVLETERSCAADGVSLVGVLMIVVVMGVLGATAILGLSSLTGGSSSGIPVVHNATSGTTASSVSRTETGGLGIAGFTGHSETVACEATAAGARSASTLYFASNGGSYPATWTDLTTTSPPLFSPATNVTINAANPKELDGRGWKLILAGGGASAPTFTCR